MIYLDVTGRCGNQMFQYAFARKLMKINNQNSLHISFYNVERWRKKTHDSSFSDQLQYFKTIKYDSDIENGDMIDQYGSKKQKSGYKKYHLNRKIANRLHSSFLHRVGLHSLNRYGIYKEDECQDELLCCCKEDNIFAKGYFENVKYFEDIRKTLLVEFEPKCPRKKENAILYDIIDGRESVCVSFRVWNEVSNDVAAMRDVCGKMYYERAIEKMHELHPNAVFIVFSNDVEWVKNHFNFKYETYFESGHDEIWEKMRLMYSCKHFIMAPSTFTWWAQYLCRNEGKTVISPNRWYNDETKETHLLDSSWIRIAVD